MTVPTDFLEQAALRLLGGEGERGGFVFLDEVAEANPYHDKRGRFTSKGAHSPALDAALGQIEEDIRFRDGGEAIYVLDENGNIVDSNTAVGNATGATGALASVSLTGTRADYEGTIVTHNHPRMGDSDDILRKYDTFSPDDIKSAMAMGLSEARMVSPVATHVLKPGRSGWGTPERFNDAVNHVFKTSKDHYSKRVGNDVFFKRIELTRDIAKDMGWSFEVIPHA